MKDVIHLRRNDAAKLIDKIRSALARYDRGTTSGSDRALQQIEEEFRRLQIPPLEPCHGEAHSNPYIDNCGVCAPRWGLVGPTVKIR